jgi:hypothetical protein
MTNDFTENTFTPHHQREQILDFLEECRFELGNLLSAEVGYFNIGLSEKWKKLEEKTLFTR